MNNGNNLMIINERVFAMRQFAKWTKREIQLQQQRQAERKRDGEGKGFPLITGFSHN